MNGPISASFLEGYHREINYYKDLASGAEDFLRSQLVEQGVSAIVSSRAKSLDRVEAKIQKLYATASPASNEQVRQDIYDLAGVRVALYLPGQQSTVARVIEDEFTVIKSKVFPHATTNKHGVFPGYHAQHFIVKLAINSYLEFPATKNSALLHSLMDLH